MGSPARGASYVRLSIYESCFRVVRTLESPYARESGFFSRSSFAMAVSHSHRGVPSIRPHLEGAHAFVPVF